MVFIPSHIGSHARWAGPTRARPARFSARRLRCAFAGAVAPGAGADGAEGLDAIPVFGAADKAGVGEAGGFADVALGVGAFGGGGAFANVDLDAAADGVP